jgi:polysaccharide export outer membrane protein
LATTVVLATALPASLIATQARVAGASPAATEVTLHPQDQPGSDYRLEPGDKLRIDVYKDDHMTQSVQIRPDGKITMPLVGDVLARGFTPLELRDRLAIVLEEYVNKPVVSVVVVEATAPLAYIVGEVNRPGAVVVQGRMTVLQALAVGGGLKDFADVKNIRILRKDATQTIPFDYKAAMKGLGAPVYLLPGDTVTVPD